METDRLQASVEEACLNAWPALKEIFYDGWLIRLSEGETRRTNSVNVMGRGRYKLADKIAYCEAVYRAHGLPAYFRIRSTDDPALEAALDGLGFRAEDETKTLHMDFAKTPVPRLAGAGRVEILPAPPSEEWLAAHAHFSGRPIPLAGDIRRRLLDLVALPIGFAALRDEAGRIVSLAYGAVHDGLVSLQWVATDPARRREGLSRAVLSALLHWAAERGARGACLQVVATNAPAVRLYERIGFDRELYRYHYRVQ
jgi:ribosomal protein S18 acetylase RimI-like enzyme